MPDKINLAALFKMKPKLASEYLKNKVSETSWNWYDIYEKEHDKIFTVAKTAGYDVLKDIRAAVQKAIDEGTTLKQFQKELKPTLQKKGWWGKTADPNNPEKEVQLGSCRRLETIYRTNLRTSYQAGRYQALEDNAKFRPFWQYVAVLDDRTRKEHKELNGKVFRHDDPFWENFFPPNGWNCRCTVKSLSQKDLDRLGLKVESSAGKLRNATAELPDGTKVSGKVYRTNGKIIQTDVGWNYNPGRNTYTPHDDGKDPVLKKQLDKVLANIPKKEEIQTNTILNDVKKENTAEVNISNTMQNYMNKYSKETPRGYSEIICDPGLQYRAQTNRYGRYWLSGEVGSYFNSALLKIRNKKKLSFDEEYSVKTVWHEICHNRAKKLADRRMTTRESRIMETINEYVARRTYHLFLERLGGTAAYQNRIIYKSESYGIYERHLNKFMEEYNLETPESLKDIEKILFEKQWLEIEKNFANWAAKKIMKKGQKLEDVVGFVHKSISGIIELY